MRILVVAGWTYPDEEGGSFRVVYETARRLAARGHSVHVATQHLKPEHAETEELAGITLHRYPTTAKSSVRFYWSTYREVRRLIDRLERAIGFDALLTHHPVSAFAANRTRSIAGLPRVAMLHMLYFLEHIDRHSYDPETGKEQPLSLWRHPLIAALRWLDRWNLRRSDRIVVLSDFTRTLLERHVPEAIGKAVKLPGGADLDAFDTTLSREVARDRLDLPVGLPIFFTCRRLEHRMGIVDLVGAAQRLCSGDRRFRLLIAGRGALEEALRQRIADAGMGDTVRLLGFVPESELPLYYRAADCFVLPTRALEGFGLVTAEAFACGTPVLGTPVGATPELIEPFDPRLVTRDATAEGIMEGMARFLDEVAAEPHLSERCRAYAEQAFSWDPMIDGLEQLFRELVENQRKAELVVFAVALVARLTWVGYVERSGRGLFGPDAPSYDALAVSLVEGRGLEKLDFGGLFTDPTKSIVVRSFRPPLLPVVLAGVYGTLGHHYGAARVVLAAVGAVTCIVVMAIARRIFGRPTDLAAGLMTALYPKLIYYSAAIVTETPCTYLLVVAVALLLAGLQAERAWWPWAAAGVALGLTTLTRSSAMLLAPLVAAWIVVVRANRRRALAEAALVGVAFILTMTPWWIHNVAVHGRFIAATTEGGYTLWVTNNERADGGGHCFLPEQAGEFDGLTEAEIDRLFWRKGTDYIRGHPGHFVRLAGAKFVRFWRLWPHADHVGRGTAIVGGVTFIPILLLALYGLLRAREHWRPLLLFLAIFGYYTALHMVFMAITRYRVPLEPYLIVLAAWGAVDLASRLGRRSETR